MNAVGKTFGAYRVLELIGEGGMGQVYRAEHQRLGRIVALKLLRPELAYRGDVARRFLEEARAVNDIHHPQIVDIYDFLEDLERNPPLVCMVMELLEGESLASYIARRGGLPLSEVVHITSQVTEVLEAVHRAQILHRDLKAENIFMLRGEGPKRIKLLDFGSIKSLGERRQLNLTDPGTALGTPEYMAPEQVLGERLDERTDVYALGVVLYKMISGKVPFSSPSYGALMVDVLKTMPPPMAGRRVSSWPPIPKALEAVVMRCLQKKPKRRYQSMGELREALQNALAAVEASSRPSAMLGQAEARRAGDSSADNSARSEVPPLKTGALPRHRRARVLLLSGATLVLGLVALLLLRGDDKRAVSKAPAEAASQPVLQASALDRPNGGPPTVVAGVDRQPAMMPSAVAGKRVGGGEPELTEQQQPTPAGVRAPQRTRSVAAAASASKSGQPASTLSSPPRRPRAAKNKPSAGGSAKPPSSVVERRARRKPARVESTTVDPFSM